MAHVEGAIGNKKVFLGGPFFCSPRGTQLGVGLPKETRENQTLTRVNNSTLSCLQPRNKVKVIEEVREINSLK